MHPAQARQEQAGRPGYGLRPHTEKDGRTRPHRNTRDFRCLSGAGVLQFSCSVWVLQSVSRLCCPGCRRGFCPRVAAGVARGSTVRGPGAGAVTPSWRVPSWPRRYPVPGASTGTWGFPGTVCFVAQVCANFGRAFWARGEWRWRPVTFRVCSAARAAASAAAAMASSDDDVVTWEEVMERIAWRQTAVKDSSSGVTGVSCLRRRVRAAAASLCSAAAALARTSWVAASQAQASWMTRRGDPERSTGPEVRCPAPVIVVLSSPNVVSDALHRARYASRTAPAGAAW